MSFGYNMASQSSVEIQEHEKAFRNGDFYVGGWRDGVRDTWRAQRRHRCLAQHFATVISLPHLVHSLKPRVNTLGPMGHAMMDSSWCGDSYVTIVTSHVSLHAGILG